MLTVSVGAMRSPFTWLKLWTHTHTVKFMDSNSKLAYFFSNKTESIWVCYFVYVLYIKREQKNEANGNCEDMKNKVTRT